ncbi:MAG: hypothetical protein M3O03_13160 [Pseudomonadota bacterium]|nr:hypothetical protein [Pseudomonadota bacterium]
MRFRSIVLSGAVFASILGLTPHALQLGNLVSTAEAQNVSLDFSVFYDGIRGDGDWVNYDGRYVFVPTGIDDNWRPYTRGHWSHTGQYGWVWVSDERFGWATYHYGRWGYAHDIGWYWVPGRRWAPAWVSWRRSDRDVAWAPLPPSAYEDDDYSNVDSNFNVTLSAQPSSFWISVSAGDFQNPDLNSRIIRDPRENQRIYDRSRFEGPVIIQNNTVINNVINVNFIQQQSGQPVQNVTVQTTADPAAAKSPQGGEQKTITAFQGAINATPNVKPPDVKPLQQVQEQLASKPKLSVPDTAKPAALPAAGATAAPATPAAGATAAPATPAAGATAAPATPAASPTLTTKAGVIPVPPVPGQPAPPAKAGTVVSPVNPSATTTQPANQLKGDGTAPPAVPADLGKVDNTVKKLNRSATKPLTTPQVMTPKPQMPVEKIAPVGPQPPVVKPPLVKAAPVQTQQDKIVVTPKVAPAPKQLAKPANPPPTGDQTAPKKPKPGDRAPPCGSPDAPKDCTPQ